MREQGYLSKAFPVAVCLFVLGCAAFAQTSSAPSGGAASQPTTAASGVMSTGDAEALFNKLYLEKFRSASFSAALADNVEVANELLKAMADFSDQPALTSVFCDKIVALVGNNPSASSTMLQAMQMLADRVPQRRLEAMNYMVTAMTIQYQSAQDDQKYSCGLTLIEMLKDIGEAQFQAGEYAQSLATLGKAMPILEKINPSEKATLQFLIDRASEREKIGRQMVGFLSRLKDEPRDRALRKQIINTYIADMDQPELAAKYLDITVEEPLQSNVKLAAGDLKDIPEKDCETLGDFYLGIAGAAKSIYVKDAMYRRAKACYESFLAKHAQQDVDRTRIEVTLKKVSSDMKLLASTVPTAWVDLMRMGRIDKDVKGGTWALKDGKLQVVSDKGAMMTFPAQLSGDYELQVRFERKTDNREVFVSFPVGSSQVSMIFSAGGGDCSGLAFVQKKPVRQSTYVVRPGSLENGHVYTLDLKIVVNPVKEGDTTPPSGEIHAKLDGKDMLVWRGPLSDLSADYGYPGKISVGVFRVSAVFHSVRVKPLGDFKPLE